MLSAGCPGTEVSECSLLCGCECVPCGVCTCAKCGPSTAGASEPAPLARLRGPDCFPAPWAGLGEASLLKVSGTPTLGRLVLTVTQFFGLKHISQSVISLACQSGRCQLQGTGGPSEQV